MQRILAVLVLLAACGDNSPPVDPPDDIPPDETDPCPALELGPPRLQFNWFSQVTGIRYPIKSGDLKGSFLLVELYDSTSPNLPALTTGTFDLTAGSNTNLST